MRFILLLLLLELPVYSQVWKGMVIAGSNEEHVFDNARMSISTILQDKGMKNITLSSDYNFIGTDKSTLLATPMNIVTGFNILQRRIYHRCFIYMTSHGVKNKGVMMGGKVVTPYILDTYIQRACRGAPSVIVISACYSGLFIKSERFARPDRIILTASMHDRPSFGCTNDEVYTYYDQCFINTFTSKTESWRNVHKQVRECVRNREEILIAERKEVGLKPYQFSNPQLHIGDMLQDDQ